MRKSTRTLVIALMAILMAIHLSVPAVFLYAVTSRRTTEPDTFEDPSSICEDSEESDYEIPGLKTVTADFSEKPSVELLAYTNNGYKTYLNSDTTFKWAIANSTAGGNATTSMQGMNTGTTYIYTAKINNQDIDYTTIWRTNANTGDTIAMNYYASTSATSASACRTAGHANDMNVVTTNSVNYLFIATCQTGKALSRHKIDGNKLYFTGYFDLKKSNGSSISCGGFQCVKHTGGYLYMLIKSGMTFYTCKIADTATGGSASNPTPVTCYRLFTIDTMNAVFATSNSSYATMDDLETWVNQDFSYSSDEGSIYVPLYNRSNDNVILVYTVADLVTLANLQATTDRSNVIFPCTLTFRVKNTSYTQFEIENVGFRTGQGTTGDRKMYFNTNCSSASREGIFQMNYNRNSYNLVSIVNENSIIYTVKYEGNGGTVPDGTESYFKMNSTRHVYGIAVKLRPNSFARSGYTFAGWHLRRDSDQKWLYFDTSGTARWYLPGEQPAGYYLATYADGRKVAKLTTVNGDTVHCIAQWRPNASSGTSRFIIKYEPNGGTGTAMPDTIVTYGTNTAINTNTYTRQEYYFSGWIAHRESDNSWAYKNSSFSDKWIAVGGSTSGYFLKAYTNGCNVSKTSSTDRDIITFYAVWSKVENPVYPASITAGSSFAFGGTVKANGDIYQVIVSIKNASGTVVKTKTVTVKGREYNLAGVNGSGFSTSGLAAGSYTYIVTVKTMNTSSVLTSVNVLSKPFTVN